MIVQDCKQYNQIDKSNIFSLKRLISHHMANKEKSHRHLTGLFVPTENLQMKIVSYSDIWKS